MRATGNQNEMTAAQMQNATVGFFLNEL